MKVKTQKTIADQTLAALKSLTEDRFELSISALDSFDFCFESKSIKSVE
jgi:hypothetical protein